MSRTVLYWNRSATKDLIQLMTEQLPAGWTLVVREQSGSDEQLLAQTDYLVVPDAAVTADDLAKAQRLRMIQHQGVGYERIDIEACKRRGTYIALTPEGTSVGVAEHVMLLILALYKQLVKAANGVGEGRWMQWELRPNSFELSEKTLGIVGFGRIGQEVARRAKAFDAQVLYFDPYVASNDHPLGKPVQTLKELLSSSDIVTLHVPAHAENRQLINRESLGWMRPGAVLVNTARGSLVDEAALAEALQNGHLAGAALDVLEKEPPAPDNALLRMENVLITPHIAAGTRDAFRTKMRAVFANLMRFERGETPHNIVPELKSTDAAFDSTKQLLNK